jgi:hypothetical protein
MRVDAVPTSEQFLDTTLTALSIIKEWQPLLSSMVLFVAACILARTILHAARIRVSNSAQLFENASRTSHQDLRKSAFSDDTLPEPPADIVQNLERLRSLIRSALAALTFRKDAENGVSTSIYERIFDIRLERSTLPADTPENAGELLVSLSQKIHALRLLVSKSASTSEISTALIKLNTIARDLATQLSGPIASIAERPLAKKDKRSK